MNWGVVVPCCRFVEYEEVFGDDMDTVGSYDDDNELCLLVSEGEDFVDDLLFGLLLLFSFVLLLS